MQVDYKPEDEGAGATPLSANYKDTIEKMMAQLANKAGRFVTGGGEPSMSRSVMGTTRDRLANVVAGYTKMLQQNPEEIPMPLKVVNPAHPAAQFAQKYYPKMYKRVDEMPQQFAFDVTGQPMGIPIPSTPEGVVDRDKFRFLKDFSEKRGTRYGGANIPVTGGEHVLINIGDKSFENAQRIVADPEFARHLAGTDPIKFATAMRLIPHEIGHSVRERIGGDYVVQIKEKGALGPKGNKPGQERMYAAGMPLPKEMKFRGDEYVGVGQSSKVGNRLEHLIASKKPGGKARLDADTIAWIRGALASPDRPGGYTPDLLADEALIEQAATNQSRMAARKGMVDPQLYDQVLAALNRRAENSSAYNDPSITTYLEEVFKRSRGR